ncbi:MAG: hypothetical protein INQ03_17215 [Candidatus Heimdallarchaeota archaeon]|nr:hypothetical protein [Candidatus Heimdallarchaeota archaeon]
MKNNRLLMVLFLSLVMISSTEAQIVNIEVQLGSVQYYYMNKWVQTGQWDTPYYLTNDTSVFAKEGNRIIVVVDEIDGDMVKFNISSNNPASTWGYIQQNATIFGSYVIHTNFSYWMDVNNIHIKDQYLEEFSWHNNISVTEQTKFVGDQFIYKLSIYIPEELRVWYWYTYGDNGAMKLMEMEIQRRRDLAMYTSDSLFLYFGSTAASFEFDDSDPGTFWYYLILIPLAFGIAYKMNTVKPEDVKRKKKREGKLS